MALDEAISEAVRRGLSPPTLRIYQWEYPSISIGHFQRASDINMDYCSQKGYPLVRRPTGGRAILHNDEITYSLSTRFDSNIFKGSLHEDYSIISNAILSALKLCGIDARISHLKRQRRQRSPACFKSVSYGEITVEGKKLTGNAQKRYADGFLQQGSIPISIDRLELKQLFNEEFDDVIGIKEILSDITLNDLRNALKKGFEETLNVKMISDDPTDLEIRLARELEAKKYSTDGWNLRR
jgi:lipoate-protein ligase A